MTSAPSVFITQSLQEDLRARVSGSSLMHECMKYIRCELNKTFICVSSYLVLVFDLKQKKKLEDGRYQGSEFAFFVWLCFFVCFVQGCFCFGLSTDKHLVKPKCIHETSPSCASVDRGVNVVLLFLIRP